MRPSRPAAVKCTSEHPAKSAPVPDRSAKRTAKERAGVHAWLPYYAGFSEDFVASLLDEFKVGDTAIVFDPMNGSGTTTLVAQQTGYCCIGADLNPAAAAIARAKNAALVGRALAEIAKETADAARRISRLAEMSP